MYLNYILSKQEFSHCEPLGALANAALIKVLLKLPAQSAAFFGAILDVEVHAFGGTAGGASLCELVETPTTSADGTARTPTNKNRLDTPSSTTISTFLNTDATAGTVMRQGIAALSQNWCSGCFVLKPATNYLVRVTNQSGAALINGMICLNMRQIPNFDQMYRKNAG
jgi:hypothetical protein